MFDPTPTFEEFLRTLSEKYGVRVREVLSLPFHQPNYARVLEREIDGIDYRRAIEFKLPGEHVPATIIRSVCERFLIDPRDFGVRPLPHG